MNRTAILAALLSLTAGPSLARAGEVKLNGHTFTIPDGFTIEPIAGPPLVDRPIVADFDGRGRLYVADSSGSNDNVQKQLAEKPHRVVRLEDADGDGHFDKSTVFADKMMFPEGVMWHGGSLYVSAPPSIWKLIDTDDDGVADRREEWFDGKTLTGCANDLHGPYLGPDGRIYWCKGAFARQTYDRPGRPPLVTRAAHIFRARPDGSEIEPVMTGGMDNPVDVAFTPGGERIFTTTFLQHPGGGNRDGLIHAVYGGVYGKVHDVIDDHPRTGPGVMPVMTHLGAAAPCGLTTYTSNAFGDDYRDNLFAALFNMQKVTRHVLEPEGATFKTRDGDFLVSDNRDFHPTDVLEDADGSLLVIDTGGWYKLCCPTSQLWKPDVLGAIYRIRRAGAPRIDDPRGLKVAWDKLTVAELADRLGDPRPAVRRRAVEGLVKKNRDATASLGKVIRSDRPVEARRNAVWALTQIDHPEARAAARFGLDDADETVRQAAIHSASVWRDRDAMPRLLRIVRDGTAPNRRAAAEALGRLGSRLAVPALLAALSEPADRVLEHSLAYALIEIDDPKATAAGLRNDNPSARRAALIALDQLGAASPEMVAPALAAGDPSLKEAAAWIAGRHPEWGGELAGLLDERLSKANLPESDRAELAGQLARFARTKEVRLLLASALRDASAPRERRLLALRAMAQSGLKDMPDDWIAGIAEALASGDVELIRQAVATARALPIPKERAGDLAPALLRVARDAESPVPVRLEALAGVPGGLAEVSPEVFAFLREQLDPGNPVTARLASADVLAKAGTSAEQRVALTDAVKSAGPLEINRLLAAFETSPDEEVGRRLITALKDSSSLSSLRVDLLKALFAKYPEGVGREAEPLYEAINADLAQQQARIEGLLTSLTGGDVRRGQAVFNGQKAACSTCHAIGYLGGRVGPDLTAIGKVRNDRDLLESIVFPSASFVRSFEPVVVATKDGQVHSGILRKDADDEVVLAVDATKEARVPRDEVAEMRPGTVSVMPSGLDQQLTRQELADLLEFLKTRK